MSYKNLYFVSLFMFLCMAIASCNQYPSQRKFNQTLKIIKNDLFMDDTTWHNARYESTLTRSVQIYETDENKMDDLVSELQKFYTLIYCGSRDAIFDAYNYPHRCKDRMLLKLPRKLLEYATDYTQVAIYEYNTSFILVGFNHYFNFITIYEPYLDDMD